MPKKEKAKAIALAYLKPVEMSGSFINRNDLAGGDHFGAVFLEGGDEAVDDVAFEVVVLLAIG